MTEVWKEIEEFEGYYLISNFGRVFSTSKLRSVNFEKGKSQRLGRNLILSPYKTKNGYLQISFKLYPINKKRYIHRLVAKAFISNPDNKKQINHLDGNKSNNRVENLEWCTNQENRNHAVKNFLQKTLLNKKQVLEIRSKFIPRKYPAIKLAKEYGVSKSCIQGVLYNLTKTWENIF